MVTYLVLNAAVLGLVIAATLAVSRRTVVSKPVAASIILLCLLTAVFDSFIVASGIVAYNSEQILGARIGAAPIEDFAYAIVAGLIVPVIFEKLGSKHE